MQATHSLLQFDSSSIILQQKYRRRHFNSKLMSWWIPRPLQCYEKEVSIEQDLLLSIKDQIS